MTTTITARRVARAIDPCTQACADDRAGRF